MQKLVSSHYPGNVRELEHVVERAVIMSNGHAIRKGDVISGDGASDSALNIWSYQEALRVFHRDHLLKVLCSCRGNNREAARMLLISHAKLYRLLSKAGLAWSRKAVAPGGLPGRCHPHAGCYRSPSPSKLCHFRHTASWTSFCREKSGNHFP